MSTVQDYRILDRDIALLSFEMHSSEPFEHTPFSPSREDMKTLLKRNADMMQRAEELEVFDNVSKIFKSRFIDVLQDQRDRLERMIAHPAGLLGSHVYYIQSLGRHDKRTPDEKIALCLERMNKLPEVLNAITDLLIDHPEAAGEVKANLDYAVSQLKDVQSDAEADFDGCSEEMLKKLMNGFEDTADLLENYGNALVLTPAKKEDPMRIEAERYGEVLMQQFGVSLEELLRDYEADIEETRNRVFSLAEALPIPEEEKPKTMQEVSAILNKYAGPAENAEKMFARIQDYLARGRKIAHENVNLPEDETCRCHTIPATLKVTFPWGGYEGGDESRRPITGQMFLNNYNVSAVTDGWMKINAIHECYPGHHVQYVRRITDRTPECVKMDSRNIPLIEGTSIRTETVFQEIYNDDPFYPVFAAYRRHHASVRIKVDIMLYIQRKSAEECRDVYIEELGFDPATAMGQVQAQISRPGYFTCYHYGLKKILQWEKESGLNRRDYTELLFRAGDISITAFHDYLQLTPEERYSYSHDYASLLRDFSDLPDMCSDYR